MRSYADCAIHLLQASSQQQSQSDPSEALAYLTLSLVTQLSSQPEQQVHALHSLSPFTPPACSEATMPSFAPIRRDHLQFRLLHVRMLTRGHNDEG